MRKAFKYRLYPNKETEHKLLWTLARARELYNAGLTERRDAYNFHVRQHPNYYDEEIRKELTRELTVNYSTQQNALPEIKHELREEYQEIAAHVLQDVLRRLDKAFQNFFRRVREGASEPGYPRFQGKHRYNSFTYPDGAGWKLTTLEVGKKIKGTLSLSKIGTAKVTMHRKLEGKIKTVTIKHEVDQWYVTFSCEVDAPLTLPVSSEDVGIDLGVTHLATLSNGEMIEHPGHYRRGEKKLAKCQQVLARKKKGSHRRKKAGRAVAKAHRKIARQRHDFSHKASRKLVNRYQVIVFEDIQMSNLVRKPKPKKDEATGQYLPNGAASKGGLNKSILDAGWGMFVSMCSCKAEEAGRTLLKVSPKYTSQLCSNCGTVRKKDLSERWHSCDCGAELDRDVNAAINILERGRRQQLAMAVEAPCL
ncbi:MAG: RNA-guided endonuclease InsQ/TnpB family protein [Ktedonobacteraceae bacterium]